MTTHVRGDSSSSTESLLHALLHALLHFRAYLAAVVHPDRPQVPLSWKRKSR